MRVGDAINVPEGGARYVDQEVVLDGVEGTLDTSFPVGVTDRVSTKDHTVALGECPHLCRWDHVLTRALQHDDMGVVDHHLSWSSLEIAQGLGEEELALEAREAGVQLDKDHPRVAQHE